MFEACCRPFMSDKIVGFEMISIGVPIPKLLEYWYEMLENVGKIEWTASEGVFMIFSSVFTMLFLYFSGVGYFFECLALFSSKISLENKILIAKSKAVT